MKPLLLLHGAIGSQDQLTLLKDVLSKNYKVYTLNFPGHGGRPFTNLFSIESFAAEVVNWINEKGFSSISIFGYSMGGYVALYIARHHPLIIDTIITLATKFHWDAATAAKEAAALQPERIKEKIPAFAATLQQRHQPNEWEILLDKTAALLHEIATANPLSLSDFSEIKCPVLLMVGDRDKMVTLVETVTVYKQLPMAQLGVLPSTLHAIETADPQLLSMLIKKIIQ